MYNHLIYIVFGRQRYASTLRTHTHSHRCWYISGKLVSGSKMTSRRLAAAAAFVRRMLPASEGLFVLSDVDALIGQDC